MDHAKAGVMNTLRASPRRCASSTRASSRTCRRTATRSCWRWAREKIAVLAGVWEALSASKADKA